MNFPSGTTRNRALPATLRSLLFAVSYIAAGKKPNCDNFQAVRTAHSFVMALSPVKRNLAVGFSSHLDIALRSIVRLMWTELMSARQRMPLGVGRVV